MDGTAVIRQVWQMVVPVLLVMFCKHGQLGFKGSIDPFHHAIRLDGVEWFLSS